MTRLVTGRLVLRPARQGDAPAFHQIMRHPQAMRYWSTLPHPDLDTTRKWLAPMIDSQTDFVIEHQGRVIGKAGAWRLPEIGLILHPDHWGQGLGTEAIGAIIGHVFATSDVAGLTVDIDPRNQTSLALFRRLGFVETGRAERTFKLGDGWADSIYMRLPRPDGH